MKKRSIFLLNLENRFGKLRLVKKNLKKFKFFKKFLVDFQTFTTKQTKQKLKLKKNRHHILRSLDRCLAMIYWLGAS